MNKVILGLILAVCLLGMALVMLNERLGRKSETPPPQAARETTMPSLADVNAPPENTESARVIEEERRLAENIAAQARDYESEEAREALAPPREDINPAPATPPRLPEARPAPQPKPAVAKPEPRPEAKPGPGQEPKPVAEKPAPEKPKPSAEKPAPEKPKPAAEKPKAESPKQEAPKTITKFVVFSRDKGATIRITGSAALKPKTMLLENPTRLVIDLNGDWKFTDNPGIPKNDLVSAIRVGKTGNRVVLDLKEKPRVWRLIPSKNSDSFDIRVDK
ncbi:MAG: AMIN domain-containing protein [Desulfovibrio sp.]|nr:AMIN domain-containing protein [Desulfovibrio sp.]